MNKKTFKMLIMKRSFSLKELKSFKLDGGKLEHEKDNFMCSTTRTCTCTTFFVV